MGRKSPVLAAALNCMPILALAICWGVGMLITSLAGNPPPPGCGQESSLGLVLAPFAVFALFSGGYGYLYLGGGSRFVLGFFGLPGILIGSFVSLSLIDLVAPGLFSTNCTTTPLAVVICVGMASLFALGTAVDAWLLATKRSANLDHASRSLPR